MLETRLNTNSEFNVKMSSQLEFVGQAPADWQHLLLVGGKEVLKDSLAANRLLPVVEKVDFNALLQPLLSGATDSVSTWITAGNSRA
jgi:hypothetical protein